MKKQRNCWWYGLTISVVIIVLVSIPTLIISGLPENRLAYGLLLLVPLGLGTLLFGCIDRYDQRRSDKTKRNGN